MDTRSACDLIDGRLLLSLAAAAEAAGECGDETLGLTPPVAAAAAAVCQAAGLPAPLLPLRLPGAGARGLRAVCAKEGQGSGGGGVHEVTRGSVLAGILEPLGGMGVIEAEESRVDVAAAGSSGGGGCGELVERGWKVDQVLPSFIWTHCRDQNAVDLRVILCKCAYV